MKDAEAHWIFFPHFAFPPVWHRTTHHDDRMTCLEHNESVEAFSLAEPLVLEYLEYGMAAREDHDGRGTDKMATMFMGIHGDYGECMVMAGCRMHDPSPRADWQNRLSNTHNHYGFWCAEPMARADFRRTRRAKSGGIERLKARWGTTLAADEDVVYPATPAARRHFRDFTEWYYDGMLRYTREWVRRANRQFDTPSKLLPLGGGDMDLRICQHTVWKAFPYPSAPRREQHGSRRVRGAGQAGGLRACGSALTGGGGRRARGTARAVIGLGHRGISR